MSEAPKCPKCTSQYVYADADQWVCPECAHTWSMKPPSTEVLNQEPQKLVVRDAHGNVLSDGDSVTIVKELKIKGSSSSVKVGTKVKKIRLIDSDDGHNIGCKIDGVGSINLKSEFVKKA